MLHKDLTGDALHISKMPLGVVSPLGVRTPTVIGEIYGDTVTKIIWMATGLTSADWVTSGIDSALTFSLPLIKTGDDISIPKADATHNGYLDKTDWNKFNSGVAFTPGNLTSSTGLTIVGGVGSTVTSTGVNIVTKSGYHFPTTADQTNWDDAHDKAHNSTVLGTKEVSETNIGNNKILAYNQSTDKIVYIEGGATDRAFTLAMVISLG